MSWLEPSIELAHRACTRSQAPRHRARASGASFDRAMTVVAFDHVAIPTARPEEMLRLVDGGHALI